MYFLRKISGFVSGVKTKKTNIEGKIVTYSYQGKFLAINPFSMLRDFSYKAIEMDKEVASNLEIDFSSLQLDCLPQFGNEISLQVETKIEGKNFRIERRVKKMDHTPHTCYDFYFDEDHLGKLIKKYDHGTQFQALTEKVEGSLSIPNRKDSNQTIWKKENQFLKIENFGHTQAFNCFDVKLVLHVGNYVS